MEETDDLVFHLKQAMYEMHVVIDLLEFSDLRIGIHVCVWKVIL